VGRIEQEADRLLDLAGISEPPVDVELVAKVAGATVEYVDLDRSVSGMLYRHGPEGEERAIVAVNGNQAEVRQRFTIAHEVGHLRLHPGRPVIVDQVVRGRVNYRDAEAGLATNREEIQANAFAASLLMPEDWVTEYLEHCLDDGLSANRIVDHLAASFHVSTQAMQNRLVNLGLRSAF
jgi:Zn-dependent peptidase ImmA (M78 family)